ncbi:MAG: hypothetical protein RL226_2345 [Bacteroidota bacterium]|jgi:protein-S-isoprenylcysteine O-methyltransferase Ste14
MALIEEMEASGNWLFRWRSYLPLVLYVLAVIVIFSGWGEMTNHHHLDWTLLCLAVSLLGQVIRAITIGFTPRGTSGRNTAAGQVAEVLNTRGIYSMVRHPLYLGNFFMWMGIVLYVGNWWFSFSVVMMFWLYYERIMFAEEAFLRRKFGQTYLQWAEKTPPFIPRLSGWTGNSVSFSLRNVLKREYSGFFAIFVSFTLINAMKNYREFERWDIEFLLDPVWVVLLPLSFLIFIVLRTLKKKTRVLHVEGR